MQLAARNITFGDIRRYVVDYKDFLTKGNNLSTVSVTTTGPTSSVGSALLEDPDRVVFLVTAGVLNEVFTVNIQVTDSNGETINDTVEFTVVAL